MALAMCPPAQTTRTSRSPVLDDGRREARCPRCDFTWPDTASRAKTRTAATARSPRASRSCEAGSRSADDVDPAAGIAPTPQGSIPDAAAAVRRRVAAYWARYQRGLLRRGCGPATRRTSRTSPTDTGAARATCRSSTTPGTPWAPMRRPSPHAGTIHHLLYGPEEPPLEDRLNQLLEGRSRSR